MVFLMVPVKAAIDKNTADWLNKLDASLAKRDYYEKQRTIATTQPVTTLMLVWD